MSKDKQTAVEWLAEQMLHPEFHNPYIEQALEMEKEQIEDAELRGKEIIIIKHTEHEGGNK
jgi:hypothetical protein